MAFDASDIAIQDPRTRRLSTAVADPATARHIYELIAALPDARILRLADDLELFEDTGVVTTQMDRILRRAECLADADRILAGLKSAA